jgi:hypothetical protein
MEELSCCPLTVARWLMVGRLSTGHLVNSGSARAGQATRKIGGHWRKALALSRIGPWRQVHEIALRDVANHKTRHSLTLRRQGKGELPQSSRRLNTLYNVI